MCVFIFVCACVLVHQANCTQVSRLHIKDMAIDFTNEL